MSTKIDNQASSLRYVAALMVVFGAIALVLSAVGVYGVMAYSVTERRHEIGIRMALGSGSRDVLGAVMGRGIRLAMAGLVVGIGLALVLARLLASLIYGVSAWDPATFIGVPLLLLVVGLAACYIPARRAIRLDPLTVLRCE